MSRESSAKPTFEELSAFVDGELGEASAAGIANLADDPETAAHLSEIGSIDDLVRAHYGTGADQNVPDRLATAIRSGFDMRRRRHSGLRATWLPIAASLLIAASGLAGAVYIADQRAEQQIAAYEARWKAGQEVLETALQDALETKASGIEVSFVSGEAGIEGRINPTRTYRSRSGHWCREFSEVIESGGVQEFRRGLACRADSGGWQRLETTISGSPRMYLIR